MRKAAGLVASVTACGAAALVLSGALIAQAAPRPAMPRVQITGIFYNSPGKDTGSNASLNHEWVRLHNRTSRPISLTGWRLLDKAGHLFVFGSYTLKAHATVKIHTGHGRRGPGNRYWNHSWYIWNNDGDTATLRTAGGAAEARCRYSDPREEHAFAGCRQAAPSPSPSSPPTRSPHPTPPPTTPPPTTPPPTTPPPTTPPPTTPPPTTPPAALSPTPPTG